MPTVYNWNQIFGDLGKLVKVSDDIDGFIAILEAREAEFHGQYDDDSEDLAFLNQGLTALLSFENLYGGNITTVAGLMTTYMNSIMKVKIQSAYSTADDTILLLIDRMNEGGLVYGGSGETIEGNFVSIVPESAESGDSFDQVSSYSYLRGLTNSVVDANRRLYIEVVALGGGQFRLDLYKDAARTISDLVGHSEIYTAEGWVEISPDNSSGLRGQLLIDSVVGADVGIQVEFSWRGSQTGDGDIATWYATQMAIDDDIILTCEGAGTPGSETWRVRSRVRGLIGGSSGLITTGEPFPGDVQDLAGFGIQIDAGSTDFEVGDTFEFSLASDDNGLFQSYFRTHFTRPLPDVLDGTETIPDSLAE